MKLCRETGRVRCVEPGVGGAVVRSLVGGSVVGDGTSDPDDLKCRQFWKFEIFDFFFVGGTFLEQFPHKTYY